MPNHYCYMITAVAAFVLIIIGFIEIFKKSSGSSDSQTVSKQLRGIGYIFLAQIVLAIGASLCYGVAHGNIGKAINVLKSAF